MRSEKKITRANAPINSKNIGEVTAKLRERLGGV